MNKPVFSSFSMKVKTLSHIAFPQYQTEINHQEYLKGP